MSSDQYYGLKQLDSGQLEVFLKDLRGHRWAQFRTEQRYLLWATGIAFLSLLLAFVFPFFGYVAFCGWVCALSVGFSTVSRWQALGDECDFLTSAHERAGACETYEEFIGAPAKTALEDGVIWTFLVEATRRNRPLISAWLEAAESYKRTGDQFILYFSRDSEMALEALQRSQNIGTLQKFLSIIPLTISLQLTPKALGDREARLESSAHNDRSRP